MVNVSRCLPPKRNGITGKIPATPFNKGDFPERGGHGHSQTYHRKQTGMKKEKRNEGSPRGSLA